MGDSTSVQKKSSWWQINKKWWLIAFISVPIIITETLEHLPFPPDSIDWGYIREIILYAFVFPIFGIKLKVALDHTQERHQRSIQLDTQIQHFEAQMANARSWSEQFQILCFSLRSELPLTGFAILAYSQSTDQFEPIGEWNLHRNQPLPGILPQPAQVFCSSRTLDSGAASLGLTPCCCLKREETAYPHMGYCLSIREGKEVLAILYLFFGKQTYLESEQERFIRYFIPAVTFAIRAARDAPHTELEIAEAQRLRREIAQELHDTIGQNLAVLRLNLDRISTDSVLSEISKIRRELVRTRDIVDQAYDHMRDTLITLNGDKHTDLPTAIRKNLLAASLRAGFKAQFEESGERQELTLTLKEQILFITQEALLNVEKHSSAHLVNVRLYWSLTALIISISDDGVGLQEQNHSINGHYGLEIMHDRATALGGRLDINPKKPRGLEIIVNIPFTKAEKGTPEDNPKILYRPSLQRLNQFSPLFSSDSPTAGNDRDR